MKSSSFGFWCEARSFVVWVSLLLLSLFETWPRAANKMTVEPRWKLGPRDRRILTFKHYLRHDLYKEDMK